MDSMDVNYSPQLTLNKIGMNYHNCEIMHYRSSQSNHLVNDILDIGELVIDMYRTHYQE